MTALNELAHLTHPEFITEQDAALIQVYLHGLAKCQANLAHDKLRLRPVFARILVVGQTGDAFFPHSGHEIRAVAFPVKNQGEAGHQELFQAEQTRLTVKFTFLTRDNLRFQNREQTGINWPVHHEKLLAVHGVHPVVGGGAEAQLLPGKIRPVLFRLAAVVYTRPCPST